MSERQRSLSDSASPDEERALSHALAELWLENAGPDAELDARVRAAVQAELAVASGSRAAAEGAKLIRPARWRRWSLPLALAATVLLSFGMLRLMMPSLDALPSAQSTAPVPAAPLLSQRAADSRGADTAAPAPRETDAAKDEHSTPRAEFDPASRALPQVAAVPAQIRRGPEERTGAKALAELPPAVAAAAPAAGASSETAAAAPAMPGRAAELASGAQGTAESARSAAVLGRAGRLSEAMPEPAEKAVAHTLATKVEAELADRARAVTPNASSPTIEAALARIQRQLEAGDRAAAIKILRELRRAHPAAPLPDWAKRLLADDDAAREPRRP